KGPLMKVAQLLATIPDALPEDYAAELGTLQAHAPAMGWSFVKRRMRAELGPDWLSKFASFEREAAHAASLGQVHRARLHDGRDAACKLQYPDMASAVEADLAQLSVLLSLFKRMEQAIDPSEMAEEIADRLREELDYERERKAMILYRAMLSETADVRVPEAVAELSTGRLLTMTWLEGAPILAHAEGPLAARNRIAELLFNAWWRPMNGYGVIHGDPHLGNYAVADEGEALNLLDFGCIRIFPPAFVSGVVQLYRALQCDDRDGQAAAYESWGFRGLSRELIDVLNLWARFIYGPLLDDRVRTVADGIRPGEYGRKEAFRVRALLKEHGPVRVPREFVFMDRAAIGLGAAFLHLGAELNFHRLFEDSVAGFDRDALAARQGAALTGAGLEAG
ncbi:MAG: AarF/ABC1/UbiB kinase family protein, partial [Caulobacterales bacterium]|nr:AarF/ABC1/UbiB kinase family protein [Caulobacterales bacterium]